MHGIRMDRYPGDKKTITPAQWFISTVEIHTELYEGNNEHAARKKKMFGNNPGLVSSSVTSSLLTNESTTYIRISF